jgi:ATP-dependent RNA helicase DDX47/RRP3
MAGNSFMVFMATCNGTVRVALLLRNLGLDAIPLHGQMTQNKRLASLNKFKSKSRSILISTDVSSRLVSTLYDGKIIFIFNYYFLFCGNLGV